MAELQIQKQLTVGQGGQQIRRVTSNGECISDVPYCLNGTELYWEEFWNNLCLRYRLILQNIPATCNDCGKKLLVDHSISLIKGVLVLERR